MKADSLVLRRLFNQQIARTECRTPGEIVARLGAVQAQDYAGAVWSIALRLPKARDADIEWAIADRSLIRTWPMRGTLHFVAAEDVRWLLELLTPRIIANSAPRQRSLELDEATFQQSKRLFFEALQGDKQLTRREMFALLNQANISTAGQRGYYLLWRNAQEGSICFGPMRDKQQTFVLLDEWAPNAKRMERDQALAELANRYFSSRGPATLQDFVWWSGLKVADARAGLEAIASQLRSKKIDDQTYWMPPDRESLPSISPQAHLLPGFDEYLLAYKDRSAMLETQHSQIISPGGGMFRSTIVLNGRVFGAWRRVIKKGGVSIALQPFGTPDEAENRALFKAASDYGEFLGMPVSLS